MDGYQIVWNVFVILLCIRNAVPMPSTTPPTAECTDSETKVESCHSFTCIQGAWHPFEQIINEECCDTMFNNDGEVIPPCADAFPDRYMDQGSATSAPTPWTTTTECMKNDMKLVGCMSFYCFEGQFEPFEFTATQPCCDEAINSGGDVHPRCYLVFPECSYYDSKVENCTWYLCEQGKWWERDFLATESCCDSMWLNQSYVPPRCDVQFPDRYTSSTPPTTSLTTSPTTSPTTAGCVKNDSKVENCFSYLCQQGQWVQFEFTATEPCCDSMWLNQGHVHHRCDVIFPDKYKTTPTTVTIITPDGHNTLLDNAGMILDCSSHVLYAITIAFLSLMSLTYFIG